MRRARGLRVFLSVDASLVATAGELPAARDHVIYQHPEWLMVPRELSRELQRLEPQSPDYLGRLARWSRVNTDRVDGLYVSPLTRAAALFVAGRIRSVVERFPVDGVHVSSLLYPAGDFDYSRAALEAFRTEVVHDIPAAERRAADDVYGLNPFAYVEHYPEAWRRFRQTQLTALATLVRSEIRKVRPGAPVVATVAGDAAAALRGHLQDWSTWLDNGFLDAVLQPDGVGDAWGFTAASGPGVGSSMPVGPAPPVVLAR